MSRSTRTWRCLEPAALVLACHLPALGCAPLPTGGEYGSPSGGKGETVAGVKGGLCATSFDCGVREMCTPAGQCLTWDQAWEENGDATADNMPAETPTLASALPRDACDGIERASVAEMERYYRAVRNRALRFFEGISSTRNAAGNGDGYDRERIESVQENLRELRAIREAATRVSERYAGLEALDAEGVQARIYQHIGTASVATTSELKSRGRAGVLTELASLAPYGFMVARDEWLTAVEGFAGTLPGSTRLNARDGRYYMLEGEIDYVIRRNNPVDAQRVSRLFDITPVVSMDRLFLGQLQSYIAHSAQPLDGVEAYLDESPEVFSRALAEVIERQTPRVRETVDYLRQLSDEDASSAFPLVRDYPHLYMGLELEDSGIFPDSDMRRLCTAAERHPLTPAVTWGVLLYRLLGGPGIAQAAFRLLGWEHFSASFVLTTVSIFALLMAPWILPGALTFTLSGIALGAGLGLLCALAPFVFFLVGALLGGASRGEAIGFATRVLPSLSDPAPLLAAMSAVGDAFSSLDETFRSWANTTSAELPEIPESTVSVLEEHRVVGLLASVLRALGDGRITPRQARWIVTAGMAATSTAGSSVASALDESEDVDVVALLDELRGGFR